VKVIIAGYTAAPADPQSRDAYYAKLASVPGASGLEFGWTATTPPDLAGALGLLPAHWSVTLNDITATYQASVSSPRSGLASPDRDGRSAAVTLAGDLAASVRAINDRQGRRAVAAVEIHSAPGFANRVLQPDPAAFARLSAGLDEAVVRIVTARPGLEPVVQAMAALTPALIRAVGAS